MKTLLKIQSPEEAAKIVKSWQAESRQVVFSNGCFDIVHLGHIDYLEKARNLGDRLVIGLNTDESVRKLKGASRPIVNEQARARMMAAMDFVDLVVLFGEDTPLKLIETLKPDILVKGNDYKISNIVGADFVIGNGGKVMTLDLIPGYSTSKIIEKIKQI